MHMNYLNVDKLNIQVVAPTHYETIARQLAMQITKKKKINSAFYIEKRYEDNEFTTTTNQLSIFIGSPDENKYTLAYLEDNDKLKVEAGAYYGYNDSKAFIYGNGNLRLLQEFVEMLKIKQRHALWHYSKYLILGLFGGLGVLASGRRLSKEKLQYAQTKVAADLFIKDLFDEWINRRKEK